MNYKRRDLKRVLNENGRGSLLLAIPALILTLCITSTLLSDAGVVTGNGQNLRQITSETIQLVSIDVTIVPQRGKFLFDGTVPGMDQVEYSCTFVLRNLTDKASEVQVGFPIDSQFAQERGKAEPDKDDAKKWVLSYSFIARDDKTTYNIDFVRHEEEKAKQVSRAIFSWTMSFAPKETKTLSVNYRIPMSMAVATTRKNQNYDPKPAKNWMGFLEFGMMEFTGYITETGSTWAGKVEKAKFTVMTGSFERYLNYRGFDERPSEELTPEDAAKIKSMIPVHQAYWFRKVSPDGYKTIENGVSWEYQDFKPKDAIGVGYFLTQFPRTPEAVSPFIDALLKIIKCKPNEHADLAVEFGIIREVILATYGKEPENQIAKDFATAQMWYQPQKGFLLSKLTKNQQAVLQEFDRAVSAMKPEK